MRGHGGDLKSKKRGVSCFAQASTNTFDSMHLYLHDVHLDQMITVFDSGSKFKRKNASVRAESIINREMTQPVCP